MQATAFELASKAKGDATDPFIDVVGWDARGFVSSWVRVRNPRPTQRDFLQLLAAGKTAALAPLLDVPRLAFALSDGHTCKVHAKPAEARQALVAMATRLAGRVAHIGRSRELGDWTWPDGMPSVKPAAKATKGAPPPRITQAVFIGAWRPLGAKWYGEEEVAMRETALWRGPTVSRLVWEKLPDDHPQVSPLPHNLS